MSYFEVTCVDKGIFRIWEKKNNGVAEYVIIGDDKALLIDTGYGGKGLYDVVKSITTKPLITVNSHYHPDHSADNCYFENVYVNTPDIPVNGKSDFGMLIKQLSDGFAPAGKLIGAIFPPFDDSSVNYIPMNDGDVFDLGGRTVTVHEFHGHTRGSVMFYENKTNALFTNDSCNYGQWLFTNPEATVREYTDEVGKLYEKFKTVDKVYFSHLKKTAKPDFFIEFYDYMKKLPTKFTIRLYFKGFTSPLCLSLGSMPTYGFACAFYFKNQL